MPTPDLLTLFGAFVLCPLLFLYVFPVKTSLPLLNPKKPLDFFAANAKRKYVTDAHSVFKAGLAKVHHAIPNIRCSEIERFCLFLVQRISNHHRQWKESRTCLKVCQ